MEDKLSTPFCVPFHYKKYTEEEWNFVLKKPKKVKASHNGPKGANKIHVANPSKNSKPMYIATYLESHKEIKFISILEEY